MGIGGVRGPGGPGEVGLPPQNSMLDMLNSIIAILNKIKDKGSLDEDDIKDLHDFNEYVTKNLEEELKPFHGHHPKKYDDIKAAVTKVQTLVGYLLADPMPHDLKDEDFQAIDSAIKYAQDAIAAFSS